MTMTEQRTDYGRLLIGEKAELFTRAAELALAQAAKTTGRAFTWALTGGSTPLEWYAWCTANRSISTTVAAQAHFTVSDERHVPLTSEQSNFGHADRLLFTPLGVPAAHRHPWPVERGPAQAAVAYGETWQRLVGAGRAYEVCFLGMGDDAHTASFFPGSPLLQTDGGQLFAAVDAGPKGWRLTITPAGLRACGLIVVMTLGANKANALRRVMKDPYNPTTAPAQILRHCADRVVWLVDPAAASQL